MKQQRHASIRDIVEHNAVGSQDELRKELAVRGFHVTQATLSRDVHALKLYKGPAGICGCHPCKWRGRRPRSERRFE